MKERPILFSAPMVRALLAGTKTQTRRVVKPVGGDGGFVLMRGDDGSRWPYRSDDGESCFHSVKRRGDVYLDETPHACPYGQPGTKLWVRETYMPDPPDDGTWPGTAWRGCKGSRIEEIPERFRTPLHCLHRATWPGLELVGWRPAIHMPRWASRITLEVTGVRVERLQDISEADAIAEGVEPAFEPNHLTWQHYVPHAIAYRKLWDQIHGPGSWDANPWVWVVEFRRLEAA